MNNERYVIDARGILDARIMFETSNGKWFLDLYGKNLTDERYYTAKFNSAGIGGLLTADNPIAYTASDALNFGVRLGYRF